VTVLFQGVPRMVVQGITGREARMVVRHTLDYGTPVVAGVTPGKGGGDVDGVPVFDTVLDASAATGGPFDVALVSVPPLAALDAVAEAVDAGVRLVVVSTENVPKHDAIRLLATAAEAGATVVGPNSVGVIAPALRVKIGAIGGHRPDRAFAPGPVGVISRSGGLTAEVGLQLRLAGLGVSTAVSIGGDGMIGSTPAALLGAFAADEQTEAVVYVGEPGTSLEHDLADAIERLGVGKPIVALVVGRFIEEFPKGAVFGHAGAVIAGVRGRPSEKVRRLAEAGALTAESLELAIGLVREAVANGVSA
jgi:succinyl-CoA synthetase alpha subunit